MPIYNAASSLILHFGHGDIAVVTGRNAEEDHEDELCFVRQESHPIGAPADRLAGQPTDRADCPVRLIFDNIESLDVVIGQLNHLRNAMTARHPDAEQYQSKSE